jgi:hypothetical protein
MVVDRVTGSLADSQLKFLGLKPVNLAQIEIGGK